MAWRWLRNIKNDFIEYTFAVPGFNFTLDQQAYFLHGIGAEKSIDPTEYERANAAITFTQTQPNVDNLINQYTPPFMITIAGKGAGEALQWEFGSGFPTYMTFRTWAIRNYTNRQNITGASVTVAAIPQSSGDFTTANAGVYLCAAINDETEELYIGFLAHYQYLRNNDPNNRYSRSSQTVYMCCAASSNVYDILASSESGGGGGGEPYIGGGTSTSGGGENATFDLTSDDIDVPTLPSISASGAGLLTLYQVSMQNMRDFASYLWSPLFDVDTLKKLFNDPMDAIISLGMLPFTPTGGSTSNIFIGTSDSGVSAIRLASQYYEIDMGSLVLDTFYDSALDLNPYTKVELYLPYCGTVSINPDEFDGKSIHVVYHVDILTGACVVFVEDGSRVLVQSQGNILTAIPFTSKDFKSIFGAVLGDAAAAGAAIGALATGGISAVAGGIGLVSHVALNTVNSKVNTPHGGQCASTAGFLSVQKPYLIITRPAQCLPEDNAAYQGYPAYITATVGDLTGFIKISEAHFDGFTCTDGELKEIDRLLKEGVYVQ